MVAPIAPRRSRRLPRRALLGLAALSLFAAGPLASGCAPGFDSQSKLQGLRVLAVVPDHPYAAPGEEVTMKMTYVDAAIDGDVSADPVQILWLGGCFDPEGDQYYACFPQLAEVFEKLEAGGSTDGVVGVGDSFTFTVPDDIVSRRPKPESGPHYGIAYVFFAACAGQIKPVPPDGTGNAGSFPLGCFDRDGHRVGADRFVPGYTQIYSFEDGRTNANPPIEALTIRRYGLGGDGEPIPEDGEPISVERCDVDAETRREAACNKGQEAIRECTRYALKAVVPHDAAEIDPDATGPDGAKYREGIWVDYYTEDGDLGGAVKLVSDPVKGYIDDHEAVWTPPDTGKLVSLYAVVHDARGGASVVQRYVKVE